MSRWSKPGPLPGQTVTGSVVFGDVVQITDVDGDVTIVSSQPPPYRVVPAEVRPVPVSVERARSQPSRLLLARHQIVPFTGRQHTLDGLAVWSDTAEPVAARLVHATGGQGKTRLAAQVGAAAAAQGWTAWQVTHTPTPAAGSGIGLAPGASAGSRVAVPAGAVLVVVDYADRWPASALLALLTQMHDLHQSLRVRVRVLLLARSDGYWWPAVADRADSDLGVDADQVLLPALAADSHDDRHSLFVTAADQFATAMNVQIPAGGWAVPPLSGPGYGLVLAIHMAALAAVDAHRHGDRAPTDPAAVSAYLLRREQAYWQHLHTRTESPVRTRPELMHRVVFTATLIGAQPRDIAGQAITYAGFTDTKNPTDQVIDDHTVCYPPADARTVFEPVHPDRLGEDLIALSIPADPNITATRLARDWAPATITRLLTTDLPQPAVWTPTGVTVLVETAHRWPHLVEQVLYPLIRTHPHTIIAAGGATLTRLADLLAEHATDPVNDRASLIDVLQAIEAHLPLGRHFDLEPGAAAITQALVRLSDPSTTDLATLTHRRDMLSRRLVYAGCYDEALAPARDAAEGYRRLAETDPTRYLPMLAAALDSLSQRLAERSRHQEALAPNREAADMFRCLADADPAKYGALLTGCLHNLSMLLGDLGRLEEALPIAEEAVDLARGLVETEPGLLAGTLHHLGNHLAMLGRHEESLAVIEEGVTIQRRRARDDPAARPRFASMLSSMGLDLRKQGRLDEALHAAAEAVALSRELVAISPSVQEPGLAMTLYNLSLILSDLGRHEAALDAAQECSALHQRLAEADSAVYLPRLAPSLSRPDQILESLGRREEALAAAQEAVAIHRRLADVNPAAYQTGLADSLTHLSAKLSDWRRRSEALALSREGVDLYRRIAKALAGDPPGLAFALYGFAWVRSRVGRELRQALAAIQESIARYERLAELRPDIFGAQLWSVYHTQADVLDKLGRAAEAAAIRRQLAAALSNTGPGDGQQ